MNALDVLDAVATPLQGQVRLTPDAVFIQFSIHCTAAHVQHRAYGGASGSQLSFSQQRYDRWDHELEQIPNGTAAVLRAARATVDHHGKCTASVNASQPNSPL
jgi:hypothetical protein